MQQNYSIIFAFVAMICWGLGDFLIQKMSKKMGNLIALIWINFIGGLALFPLAIKDFSLITSWESFLNLFVLAVLDFAFGLTLLKAYEKGKLSVVEVILVLELPLTVILGLSFFREELNIIQLLLILIIVLGVVFISRRPRNLLTKIWEFITGKNKRWERGVILALIAAIFSALYNFFIALNAKGLSPVLAIWFPWTISLFFLIIYMTFRGWSGFLASSKKNLKLIFLGSVIDVSAWLCFAVALSQNKLSITTAITESYPAIAVFLGIQFNKEKISFLQVMGAILALAASIAISLIS